MRESDRLVHRNLPIHHDNKPLWPVAFVSRRWLPRSCVFQSGWLSVVPQEHLAFGPRQCRTL